MKIIEKPYSFAPRPLATRKFKILNSMISSWVGAPQNWHGDKFVKPRKLKFWEHFPQ